MRHLCIKDYYSVNYGVEIKKGYMYSAYSNDNKSLRIHYCHGGEKRAYEYNINLRMDAANRLLVPMDENSEECLFEMALKHGIVVQEPLISFLDMINTPKE